MGFRWFARETAERLKVAGWVRNLPDGDVEAEAEGEKAALAAFVAELKTGLPFASVARIDASDLPLKGGREFDIR